MRGDGQIMLAITTCPNIQCEGDLPHSGLDFKKKIGKAIRRR
jgi:hypothetical protein